MNKENSEHNKMVQLKMWM